MRTTLGVLLLTLNLLLPQLGVSAERTLLVTAVADVVADFELNLGDTADQYDSDDNRLIPSRLQPDAVNLAHPKPASRSQRLLLAVQVGQLPIRGPPSISR